ncbi:MAG: DUF4139 domain-containing protein [Holophaga sp.]|nr:DUF4139 domain-containing protein [Holophaga sp.]
MRYLLLASLPCLLAAQTPVETVTTQRDQQALAITIYNNNLALVRDQREVRLPAGDLDLAYQEVAALIRPETAFLRNLTEPKGFWINEQNFDFDLLTPQKLLEKFVGRKVTVVTQTPNQSGPGSRELREKAEVLASNGGVVLKFPDRIETAAPGRIIYPEVPGNLRARPTLVINLHSAAARPQKLELTYLTAGLSWQADYVANLAPDGKTLDLGGWVTLTNQSGSAYPGATLQLVAGDVHRAETLGRRAAAPAPMMKTMAEGNRMSEESLFEYHLYTLDRPTTLKENQTKQVALLTAARVPVRRDYQLTGQSYYYRDRFADLGGPLKVAAYVEFDNRAEANLGLPLPKGVIRVYQRDSAGRAQFVGEDAIDHTPRNEKVRLKMGDAFDLTARRRQTDFKLLGAQGPYRNVAESAFQVDLKNAKPEPVTITLLEPMQGDWEITQSSLPAIRESATLARFQVAVPASGSATLTYRARVRW